MKLKFKINKTALATDIIVFNNKRYHNNSQKNPFSFWLNLEKRLWKKYQNEPAYFFINSNHYNWAFKNFSIQAEKKGFEKTLSDTGKILDKIYKEILKSKEFKKVFLETKKYKDFVEKEWNKNKKAVMDYFKDTLGLKIPNYQIIVYIFHPKSFNGRGDYQTKTILWGHSDDWKNYSVVYLAHELLHIIADKKFSDIMHAIIELAADNELRIQLNKKGKYFNEGKYDIGHPYLKKLERKILPYWTTFLKEQKEKNIIDLEKKLSIKLKLKRG